MLNLFILIIIDQFEQYEKEGINNPLQIFKDNLDIFRKNWSLFTRKTNGVRIESKFLIDFFKFMPPPIGKE
jgi:hypothetical protein